LRRAAVLLPEDDERRAATLLDQLVMLEMSERVDERLHVIDELERSPNEALRMHGRVARVLSRLQSDPDQAVGDAEETVRAALAVFAAVGDDLGMAHAYELSAFASWLQSRAVPTVAALDHVTVHARRVHAAGLLDTVSHMLLGPLRYGPFQTDEIRARLEVIARSESITSRYSVLFMESHLAARAGDFDRALALAGDGADIAENLGQSIMHAFARVDAAHILLAAGRLDEAADTYRWVTARLEELGQTSFRSTTLLDLARVVYQNGDPDEAERLAAEGEALGATEDVINRAFGQSLRAQIAADRGDTALADELAREAVEYAYRTDFPSVQAAAHETRAYALSAAGRPQEALAERTQALELWERYGYTRDVNRLRTLIMQGTTGE
jgi:predicted negative regulator of RcsB-dependent stress response